MDNKVYSITLEDGTQINNLRLNGNNFVSAAPVDPEVFEDNCAPVVISDGTEEVTHEHMRLEHIGPALDGSNDTWFILNDITSEELKQMKMQADIEYVAMMAGVDL